MTTTPGLPFPQVGDGSLIEPDERIHREELQLAFRNKAIPLEALSYDVTPTGLHYTLTHYDIPAVDASQWRLRIGGAVRTRLELSLEELIKRPAKTIRVTMECAGDGRALTHPRAISQPWLTGGVGTAEWTGTLLAPLLRECGLEESAVEVLFTGLDEGFEGGMRQFYQRSLFIETALDEHVLLAWAMNGAPLEPQHGSPLRVVVPHWYGMANVKWLREIEVLTERFQGYQQAVAYRFSDSRDESGDPVSLMRVRSLMIPPGVPDYLTRQRVVERGAVDLRGRAWSGSGAIDRVEVSTDGGKTWAEARVDPPHGDYAWQSWQYLWTVTAKGKYELCCRARDSAGNIQPLDQFWTARGMGNNAVHRVPVLVLVDRGERPQSRDKR